MEKHPRYILCGELCYTCKYYRGNDNHCESWSDRLIQGKSCTAYKEDQLSDDEVEYGYLNKEHVDKLFGLPKSKNIPPMPPVKDDIPKQVEPNDKDKLYGEHFKTKEHLCDPGKTKQVGGDHYSRMKIQPWDIIDEYGLGFYEGTALKYLLRRKNDRLEDIKKCVHTLEKFIKNMEATK